MNKTEAKKQTPKTENFDFTVTVVPEENPQNLEARASKGSSSSDGCQRSNNCN